MTSLHSVDGSPRSGVREEPHTSTQIPGPSGAGTPDPWRDLDPLARMGVERDRRRRRMGVVIVVLLMPGLAFPLLSRRGPSRAKAACAALLEECLDRCLPDRGSGERVTAPSRVHLCFEQCAAGAGCR